ncbi:hypothetical protein AAY42_09220 [Flagellimonas eckloniae]|uniref:DUF4249 domain-containing protein n=2 Tax=Flagellimonas eckloniae TaxID=346185 RepID=A0A0Q1CGM3_9FLAO|nr:hypothetical protein AAY42_09220 [Allomuricauda eckloniae]
MGCTEPIRPEFDFKSGMVLVEGFVSTAPNGSFVKINTVNEFNIGTNSYENVFIGGAEVSFINTDTGDVVALIEDTEADIYIPPVDFVAIAGQTWELDILLDDGRQYKSLPETIMESVPISAIGVTYKPELSFNVELDDFAPGHSILVDFEDPPNVENYYYWNYRSFEFRDICVTCHIYRIYRDGTCVLIGSEIPPEVELVHPYQTYYCENDCWRIRYNQNIKIFSDKFTNGSTIERLPVADVLLYTKKDILVEVQQFSLSASAYEYYETLKDLINDNGGFNSPPSAALIGNIINPNDRDEFVLGRFTAAPAETARIILERDDVEEDQIEIGLLAPEGTWQEPRIPPEEYIFEAPCPGESRYNTSIRPEGWPTN